MGTLTRDTFQRPLDMGDRTDPAVLYARSYLVTRTIVGVLGILLPLIFIIGEAYFLNGGVHVRGSLSGYYHTSMRDVFVGGLCVIGFMLITYMSAQPNTQDFWYSLVAGVAVLGVTFFPTPRPGLPSDAPKCGSTPMPDGCSPVQQQFGEMTVGWVHFTCAAIFILCLARISFLFAHREERYEPSAVTAMFHRLCGWVIVAAVVWAAVGSLLHLTLGRLTALYLGEVAAVWAFGASWLVKGSDLWATLGAGRRGQSAADAPLTTPPVPADERGRAPGRVEPAG